VLLFATSEEPLIYSLTFSKVDTVFQGDDVSKTALPVVDLTEVEVNEGERLVAFRMHGESPYSAYHENIKHDDTLHSEVQCRCSIMKIYKILNTACSNEYS
jgi:hypothetical protein